MTAASHPIPRQAWWILLLAAGLLGLFFGGSSLYKEHIREDWTAIRVEKESDLRARIEQAFHDQVGRLTEIAHRVVSDTFTLRGLISNQPEVVAGAFRRLGALQQNSGSVIEVVDAKGTLVGWGGAKGLQRFERFTAAVRDTVIALSPAGLRSYLSAGIHERELGLIIVASYPFEVNTTVSTRFVKSGSFKEGLEQNLGQEVEIISGGKESSSTDERRLRVGLTDAGGVLLATVLVDAPTMEMVIQEIEFLWATVRGALVSISIAGLAIVLFRRRPGLKPGIRLSLVLAAVWLVRYLWLWMEFPSSFIGGWMFSPTHFASPFGGGLASSLGELSMSSAALLISVILVVHELAGVFRKPQAENTPRGITAVFFVAVLLALLGLNVILRAYGFAMRSFVHDSTLSFVDPSVILPPAEVVTMYANILGLTCGLLVLATAVIGLVLRWYDVRTGSGTPVRSVLAVGGLYGLSVMIFRMFDQAPQVPWFIPAIIFLSAVFLLFLNMGGTQIAGLVRTPAEIVLLTVAAFVVSFTVLDLKIHEKEDDRLRLYAGELIQPVDSWLSFVANESFRTVAESYREVSEAFDEDRDERSIAFPLWAGTLMSREGYNSTLAVYDESGREVDRFAVGMTAYEQTQLLQRLFEVDEEVLNVVERRVPGGLIKYYGVWGSIRDSDDNPVAYVALVLAASEQALFRGEAPEPLRPLGGHEVGRSYQSIAISEFQDGRLVVSTDLFLQAGVPLPENVSELFEKDGDDYLRIEEEFRDKEFETLYVRDNSRPGRVIAVSLESVGLRWHLFNLVKVGVLYGALLSVVLGLLAVARWDRYRSILVGFRGRLIFALLAVAIVPLVLYGYYNREFAEEQQSVQVTKRLHDDLELIRQRIVSAIVAEEDIEYGITDDFCEAIASEFGVDFTIFRRTELFASSRPELYSSGLVDARLPGEVFAEILVAGRGYAQTRESIGNVTYAVGFQPLVINDRIVGVISVPALYRQTQLEAEVAERNAFTLVVYGILLLLTGVLGVVIANQLSQPVRDLTKAAHEVGEGNLDVRVTSSASGEIRELVTTFNEMVADLRKSGEELRQVERELAWKEMAKQVAHEIKNPLTPMKLSVQHLQQAFKDRAPDLDALVARITQTLADQIDTLARIATEFSSFARMPERRFERIDVHSFLLESVQLFREVQGIEIQTIFCDTRPVLLADREELRRVIINIIRNAIQAMNQKGMITITTSTKAKECSIAISDTGPGIPASLHEKVFEPNFSTKSDGMGLGLAMARKIVEELNGTIRLQSPRGGGTTIAIVLPMMAVDHG